MEIKIDPAYLSKQKLMVATPMYGGMCAGLFSQSMYQLTSACAQLGLPMQPYQLFNESLITRARNYACDEFMRSDCTHMIFIDADIGFDPRDVIAMIALMTEDSPYDVMGAPYPKKNISYEKIALACEKGFAKDNPNNLEHFIGDFVFNPLPTEDGRIQLSEPSEVLEIGTGFMMIQRRVFERFREVYPETWYKPDHVRTEAFDGSRYISMFFQAEIDVPHEGKFYRAFLERLAAGDKVEDIQEAAATVLKRYTDARNASSERYLSEDYNFCCPASTRIITEDGIKTIKEIVDNRYTGKTISMNDQGEMEWKRIAGHSVRRNGQRGKPETKKNWVRLNTYSDNNTKAKLACTDDHRVIAIKNIFDPIGFEEVQAKDTAGRFVVRQVDTVRPIHKENPLYSKDQISFLVGTLLGDGCIHKKTKQFLVTHGAAQNDYLLLKQEIFGGNTREVAPKGFSKGGVDTLTQLHLPNNAQIAELLELFYIDGKRSVKNVISMIDEKALAFWYMDDGSLSRRGEMRLSTEAFDYEDHLLIQNHLLEKFGIGSVIQSKAVEYRGEDRYYFYLRFLAEDRDKLASLVAKYVVQSMEYKLPIALRGGEKFDYGTLKSLGFAASKIKAVVPVGALGSLYDIEVEDNHNFIANGTLVHNCQQVRKAGQKVWFCPWMQTKHMGTHIFGGSLAAMAALQTSATADPALLGKANQAPAVRPA